ncbi:MAG: hypothetical protein BWY88_00171 [Synergistetes bacterium ADurb.Bin520]|nr:MAG: hypothetical protein BWY88_00171 [Synergistetes bacterium ADurb.Bin520]
MGRLELFSLIGVHAQDAPHALFLARPDVFQGHAAIHGAGVDAAERQAPHEGVHHDLEGQGREGGIHAALPHDTSPRLRVGAHGRGKIHGARKIVHHRIEKELHALVLERRAAEHGHELHGDGASAQGGPNQVVWNGLGVQKQGHDLFVEIGQGLHDGLPAQAGLLLKFRRDGHHLGIRPHFIGKKHCPLTHQVDGPLEGVFHPYGDLDGHRAGPEALLDAPDYVVEIRPHAIHLVDEGHPGYPVLIGLAPHRFGLGLHSPHGAEHGHGTVQDPHGPLHLHGKVHVSGRINEIDQAFLPVARGGRRSNGNAPFALLLHPVHRGRALVDLSHPVLTPRVEQDPLGRGGLARVDVRSNTDIAYIFKVYDVHYLPFTIGR